LSHIHWSQKWCNNCALAFYVSPIAPAVHSNYQMDMGLFHYITQSNLWTTRPWCYNFQNLWFQKIFIPPPWKGLNFQEVRGNLPNFPGVRGCTIGKYFQWVLMVHKRVTKKKKQEFTTTIILFLWRYKTWAINNLLKTHWKTSRLMN